MSTAHQIDQQYVATGKVRVVFRNRAVIGPESAWAGEGALCAGDQGKFWEYNDVLFNNQKATNSGAYGKANLKRFAADLGLDTASFAQCLDGGKYTQRVRQETEDSERRGVTGTPTFFVNGIRIEGAQPFDVFKQAIESELRRTQ